MYQWLERVAVCVSENAQAFHNPGAFKLDIPLMIFTLHLRQTALQNTSESIHICALSLAHPQGDLRLIP